MGLSREFSCVSSRLAEGISSKGLKREINGVSAERKLLGRWDSSRDGLGGSPVPGSRGGVEGPLLDFFEGPEWLSARGARLGGRNVA